MSQRPKGSNGKKRREQELKKQQMQKKVAVLLIVAVAVVCAGGIGWTIYDRKQQNEEKEALSKEQQEQIQKSKENTNGEVVNVDPLLEYLSDLDTELLNQEIAPDTATDAAAQGE